MIQVITLFGPTASGKSALAVALARALGGEIINADSRQVYKGIPIVTACPGAADYAAVPHHLFEFVEVAERYSAGRYAKEAAAAVAAVQARGRLPMVVGGTGFYIKSLMDAMRGGGEGAGAVSAEVENTLKRDAETRGIAALWERLAEVDPEAATGVKKTDTQRVLRALGVWQTHGRKFSSFKVQGTGDRVQGTGWLCLALNPPKEVLNERIERRWAAMQAAGAVEEVRRVTGLRDDGVTGRKGWAEMPGLQSVGVREIGAFLDGALSWEKAEEAYLVAMRQYAKRQRTWLRNTYPAAKVWEDAQEADAVIEWVRGQGKE